MWSDETLELSRYRIALVETCLKSAELLYQNEDFLAAANCAYYAVFHAMRALLVLDGEDYKKHSGVIGRFRQIYIKTGILPENLSLVITSLSSLRNECDYGDLVTVDREEVREKIDDARLFCQKVKEFWVSLVRGKD